MSFKSIVIIVCLHLLLQLFNIVNCKIITAKDIIPYLPTTSLTQLVTLPMETFKCYSINGSGNNLNNFDWGQANTPMHRYSPNFYGVHQESSRKRSKLDGEGLWSDIPRTSWSARQLSNEFFHQSGCSEATSNPKNCNDLFWVFGQFLDHDMTLAEAGTKSMPVLLPSCDYWFRQRGVIQIPMTRNLPYYSGNQNIDPINILTSYLDASQVYGHENDRAYYLRLLKDGKLLTRTINGQEYPPTPIINTKTGKEFVVDAQAPLSNKNFFFCGDQRANEVVTLGLIHTIFVREHNRLCDEIKQAFILADSNNIPILQQPITGILDEIIYQMARSILISETQHITYHHWIPLLLGQNNSPNPDLITYDPNVKASIRNEFATALFRLHSLIGCNIRRVSEYKGEYKPIQLEEAFFNTPKLLEINEIENIIRGLLSQKCQRFDNQIVSPLRNFLFGNVAYKANILDLVSINLQRGRDHGLSSFQTLRKYYGLQAYSSIDQFTSDPEMRAKILQYFGSRLENMDPFLGIVLEEKADLTHN
ncbi:hypothetical protein ABK040_006442 [Willaertia magna]